MQLTKFERTCIWVSYFAGLAVGAVLGAVLVS